MYLLDTNVVSELRKPRPHGGVIAWLQSVSERELFISALTLGELQAGAERLRRHDPAKAAAIDVWIDEISATHDVIPMDGAAFCEWARLMEGKPDDLLEDGMVAATARIHRLAVVTRNVRDFKDFDVQLVNPFNYRG